MSKLLTPERYESPKEFFRKNSEEKIVLAVDLDECCFNYLDGFRHYLEACGYGVPEGQPSSWNLAESGWVLDETDFKLKHEEAVANGIYKNLEIFPHTKETLWDLVDSGYQINFITSRFVVNRQHLRVVKDTAEAIEKNGLPYSNLMFQKNKDRFLADGYVDDGPHNITALENIGRFVIKLNQPYNLHLETPSANNWLEVREILHERFGR